jgi:hypothetical protein
MSELNILAPNRPSLHLAEEAVKAVFTLPPLTSCNALTLSFIQSLSDCLLKSHQTKIIPELIALGFWLRRANISKMTTVQTTQFNKALGTVLHFTPANVDTMFVYSWVCSLLMGNNNIVRVASADSAAKELLLDLLNSVMAQAEYSDIAQRNLFIHYPKESNFSAVLSAQAEARVIWGGDESVKAIRALGTKPRCRDISFADRYSAALINGDELGAKEQIGQLAALLWKDTEPHGQQACSSPRVIYWLGDRTFQQALFAQIDTLAVKKELPIYQLNNHLVTNQLLQSQGAAFRPLVQNAICALPVHSLTEQMLDWHSGAGLFFVLQIESIEQLSNLVDEKLQTLSYWQVDKNSLLKLVQSPSIKGLDRIVPVGQALDFSPNWDGYELLSQLSRKIDLL